MPLPTAVRNLPHAFRVLLSSPPDPAQTLWLSPTGVAAPPPAVVPIAEVHPGSSLYAAAPVAAVPGDWLLLLRDSRGAILAELPIRCVSHAPERVQLGLVSAAKGLVAHYPGWLSPDGEAGIPASVGASAARAWVSQGKFVCPVRGWIYGLEIWLDPSFNNLPSWRFFTADPQSGVIRGISENVRSHFRAGGCGWQTLHFASPVWAEPGDRYGIEVLDPTPGAVPFRCTASVPDVAKVQRIRVKEGRLDLSGANGFTPMGPTESTGFMQLKLLLEPPAILIGGLSHWASHPLSHTTVEDSAGAFDPASDLGVMLSDLLGVPVMNVADGGTELSNWIGPAPGGHSPTTGLFETFASPYGASLFIYGSEYNEGNSPTGAYLHKLDHLLAHCDQAGMELVLLNGFGSYYREATPDLDVSNADIERLNAAGERWARENGVLYVDCYHRLGRHTGAPAPTGSRRSQKHGYPGVADYHLAGDQYIHLSPAGLRSAAVLLASRIRRR
jgi:hypothetical protein